MLAGDAGVMNSCGRHRRDASIGASTAGRDVAQEGEEVVDGVVVVAGAGGVT